MRRFSHCLVMFCMGIFLLSSAIAQAASAEITVSAAISLKDAFTEIGKLYEIRHIGTKVAFNFGASGDLMRQIEGGAPVDVFASAAQKDMDEAQMKGLVDFATRKNFTSNSLVLVVPAKSTVKVASFEDLKFTEVKKVAVGNPKTVPAGRYADEVIGYYQLEIKDKLVFGENVRQVLEYVSMAEADAGMVYMTDALTRPSDVRIAAEAGAESHKPILYPIAVVKATKSAVAGAEFIALVTSAEGQAVLKKYGFKPATGK